MSELLLRGTERGLFVPVGAHVTSRAEDALHAVDWAMALDRDTVTVCGLQTSALVVQGAVMSRPGDEAGLVSVGIAAMPWPPYKAQGRCQACWETTGRPRVDRQWREIDPDDLEVVTEVTQ